MAIKKILKTISNFLKRNHMILVDGGRGIDSKRVNLHWWQLSEKEQNLGDYLSLVVFEFMKKRAFVDDKAEIRKTKHIYAVGSIIDGGYQDATVWGSGFRSGNRLMWWRKLRKLDVRSVRGPETRRTLMENGYDCPEVYGDPAILMPLIYTPQITEKEYEYRVVQHYSLNQKVDNSLSPITDDYKSFIDEIVKSKLIISSSLHGIILAETYGVPAVLLKSKLGLFKYRDYYHSTGRYDFPVANSLEEALKLTPAPLPDLEKLRQGLLASFPVDLWEK